MAGYYGLLDCPVDICAGRADGVIAKENVRAPCCRFWLHGNPRKPRRLYSIPPALPASLLLVLCNNIGILGDRPERGTAEWSPVVSQCFAQVLLHYEAFRQEGARVTYKEFDFGHLDFTFAVGLKV